MLLPLASGLVCLACGAALVAVAPGVTAAAPLPYPQAVHNGELAARAVLARAGRESCLRGKLTRALLGLSDSCAASASRSPICALADRAVVVTPMSQGFMDQTAHQLLERIQADPAAPPAPPP
jgi:hypothetical protein